MGNVVRRFIGRGLGTIRTKPAKETPNILHKMIERIDQVIYLKYWTLLLRFASYCFYDFESWWRSLKRSLRTNRCLLRAGHPFGSEH